MVLWQDGVRSCLFLSAVQMPVMQIGRVMMAVFYVGMLVEMGMGMGLSEEYVFNMFVGVMAVVVLVGVLMENFVMDVVMLMLFVYQ